MRENLVIQNKKTDFFTTVATKCVIFLQYEYMQPPTPSSLHLQYFPLFDHISVWRNNVGPGCAVAMLGWCSVAKQGCGVAKQGWA